MRKFTLILASMFLTLGTWAQTTAYKVNEATTTLIDGTYVLVAMSDKGTGPCYYSSTEGGNRLYRYDLNKDVQVGDYIDGTQYLWTIDETTTDGVQKITVTNVGDPTKAFPVDGYANGNFQGSGVAELIPEIRTIDGIDYLTLKLENIGYIHVNSPGGNPNLSYWNSVADDGTSVKFRFYPVEAEILEDRTITYTLTDKAGNSYVGTYEGNEINNMPTFTGVAGYSLDNVQWNGDDMTADITFPFPVSSAEVTNETMIANFNATQRWHAVGSDVKVQTEAPTVATMDEWMWAIYPVFSNGAFTFKVKNIATGKFVTVNKTVSSFNTQGTVTLTDAGTALEVITWLNSPCFIVSGSNYVYLTINGTADTDVYLASWTGGNNSHAGNKLHFPNPTYNVTITEANAATLTTPFAVSLPEGVTAGYVSGVDTEKQTLEYTDVTTIPAGESVVLFGEAGTYTFNKVAEADAFGTNYLVGYSEATEIPADQTVYALGNKSNGVAFYTFTGTAYAVGKAYLQLPAATQAIGYFNVFGGEGTTGIEAAVNGEQTVVIYDLSGRRVEKMEKGIYIVNGKKVIR